MISDNIKIITSILTIWILIDSIKIILMLIKLKCVDNEFNLSWNILISLMSISSISNYLLNFIIFFNVKKFIEIKIILMILIAILNSIFIKYALPKILKTEINIGKLRSNIVKIEDSIKIDIVYIKNRIEEILNNNE